MIQCEGQISLFDTVETQNTSDPIEAYLKQAIMRGTGFAGGKDRVTNLYKENLTSRERAKRIKEEYGLGGAGWPLKGYGLHGYDTFFNGFRIQWRDENGEHEKTVDWNYVERIIHNLIDCQKYNG